MISRISNFWKSRQALNKVKQHPTLGGVLAYLKNQNERRDRSGVWANWDDASKTQLVMRILQDVERALARDSDPVQGIRMRMVEIMLEAAKYQVLVMPPEPDPDITGLRLRAGITGELKARIPDLARVDKGLQEFIYGLGETPSGPADVYDAVLLQHWKANAFMNAYNVARFTLRDYNENEGKDWFKPCFASLCIWQEDECRRTLGMPPALTGRSDADVSMRALAHSTWFQSLQSGSREPRLHWENAWIETFNEPSPYGALPA